MYRTPLFHDRALDTLPLTEMGMDRSALFWSGWHRAPMLRITLPFAIGLAAGSMLALPLAGLAVAAVVALLLVAVPALFPVPFRLRWVPYACAVPALVLLGLGWWSLRTAHVLPPSGPGAAHLVEVDVVHGASAEHVRCDALLMRSWNGDTARATDAPVMLTLGVDSLRPRVMPGDVLVVRAELEGFRRTPDPGGFDAGGWAASRGVNRQGYATAGAWRRVAHHHRWTDLFIPAQERVWRWLEESGLPDRERAVVLALLLGVRSELDADQKQVFARSGTMHVLAVSGMHVALIYWVLMTLLKPMGGRRWAWWVRGCIVLLLLWGYAGLTGATPSVLRATVMCTLFVIAGMLGRRTAGLNTLFGAAFLLLVWDPRMLFQLSFQLSFLAVLGIMLCYDPLRALWTPGNIVLRHVWSLVAVSLAAQLFTTPLSLAVFKAFPVWFLPANVVIVTLVNVGVVGGLVLLLVLPVPVLGPFVADALGGLVLVIGKVGELFAAAPLAYPDVRVSPLQAALLMLLILGVCLDRLGGQRAGRLAAMLSLPLIALSVVFQVEHGHALRQFVVFDDRTGLVMALREGSSAVVVEEVPGHTAGSDRLERFTRHTGAVVRDTLARADLSTGRGFKAHFTRGGGGAWFGAGMQVLVVGDTIPPPGPPRFDVVVIAGADLRRADAGLDRLRPGGYAVLSPALDGRARWRLRSRCEKRGLRCHDVRRDGALIFAPHVGGRDTLAKGG